MDETRRSNDRPASTFARRAHPMHRVWMPFDRQMQVGKSRRSGRTPRTRPTLLAWLRVPWVSIAGKSPLRLGAAARDRGGRCGENDRLLVAETFGGIDYAEHFDHTLDPIEAAER